MADGSPLPKTSTPPAKVERPALARWIFERNLDWRSAAPLIGKSHETVRRYCLPFGHPERWKPDEPTRAHIAALTGGEVPPPSFDAPTAEPVR